jgi:hypothetical protein
MQGHGHAIALALGLLLLRCGIGHLPAQLC